MNFVHDKDRCNDIVQDVFVKIIQSHLEFESELHFRQYAYIAVRNHCINHLKKTADTTTVNIDDELPDIAFSTEESDTYIVKAEIIRMINEAIEALPPRTKEVFRMAYIDKLSNAEIAEALGISINTVKILRQRAKAALREKLKNLYPLIFILLEPFSLNIIQ